MPILKISIFFMLCFVVLLATGANAMSQNIKRAPDAVLEHPNYAITELPSAAALEKYKVVIKNYITKTRGWSEDEYEITVESLNSQKYVNTKNGIVFSVEDLINKQQKEKEYQETGGMSTGAGRSIRVVVNIPSMKVVREFRQF